MAARHDAFMINNSKGGVMLYARDWVLIGGTETKMIYKNTKTGEVRVYPIH